MHFSDSTAITLFGCINVQELSTEYGKGKIGGGDKPHERGEIDSNRDANGNVPPKRQMSSVICAKNISREIY